MNSKRPRDEDDPDEEDDAPESKKARPSFAPATVP